MADENESKTKDWKGNKHTPFALLGANNHSKEKRQKHDFYATDPKTIDKLLEHETFDKNIWECACGDGALTNKLLEHGYEVLSSDIIDRGCTGHYTMDFLEQTEPFDGDIITNPPYTNNTEFILKALELSKRKVAMFLKIQFLETQKRYEKIFEKTPPYCVYVFVKRQNAYRNGDRTKKASAICYAWFVWDKYYNGETIVRWLS